VKSLSFFKFAVNLIPLKDNQMKNKTPDPLQVWEQLEDVLVPRLHLSPIDRAVYARLVRHSRLHGQPRLQFSILQLARDLCLSGDPVRQAVRRLVQFGALRLIERSKAGHVVEVLLPLEIPTIRAEGAASLEPAPPGLPFDLERADFLQNRTMRQAIHAREGGRCFYCLRRLSPTLMCLDHVVPRVDSGLNSYRNLVSSCLECNSHKAEKPAPDFLRWLYREGRLTASELAGGLRALNELAAGKLLPVFQDLGALESKSTMRSQETAANHSQANLLRPKGRRPLHAKPS
jgi:HNH endonuclease